MKTRKAIYTAIFNNHDTIKLNSYINDDYDYLLFTDNETLNSGMQHQRAIESNWKVITLTDIENPRKEARKIKMMQHPILKKYDETIWVDGKYAQTGDLNEFVSQFNRSFAIMKHPFKECLYKEYEACRTYHLDDLDTMYNQIHRYKRQGYPQDNGLVNSAIIYRAKTKKVDRINKAWWNEIKNGSIRDQLSFNYVIWRMKEIVDIFEPDYSAQFFKEHQHIPK